MTTKEIRRVAYSVLADKTGPYVVLPDGTRYYTSPDMEVLHAIQELMAARKTS